MSRRKETEAKREHVRWLVAEAIRRRDESGLGEVLDRVVYELPWSVKLEVFKAILQGPAAVVAALDASATSILEETYRELDAEAVERVWGAP